MQDADWDSIVDGHARQLYLGVVQKLRTGVAAQQEWLKSAGSAFLGTPQRDCARCKASSDQVDHFTTAHSLSLTALLCYALSPPHGLAAGRPALSSLRHTIARQRSARAVTVLEGCCTCPVQGKPASSPSTFRKCVGHGMADVSWSCCNLGTRRLLLSLEMTHRGLTWASVKQSGRPGRYTGACAQRMVTAVFPQLCGC